MGHLTTTNHVLESWFACITQAIVPERLMRFTRNPLGHTQRGVSNRHRSDRRRGWGGGRWVNFGQGARGEVCVGAWWGR